LLNFKFKLIINKVIVKKLLYKIETIITFSSIN